jgi:hypothetical protein
MQGLDPPTEAELAQLHVDVQRYLACVDVARSDPLELSLGLDPPAMLPAYPAVEGVQGLRKRVDAYLATDRNG